MYLFEVTDELILEIKNNDKVCKYFDVPIQHISDKTLKDMNRYDSKKLIYEKIQKIKENIPEAVLRTTVMVGFPGETENEFNELVDSVMELKFDRLGAYSYSKEEGTESAKFDNQVDEVEKEKRLSKIYEIQKKISLEKNRERVDKKYEVIVEGISEDEKYFICRSMFEAPDVDGRIYVEINKESSAKLIIGEYSNVKIIDCNEYDLFAEAI